MASLTENVKELMKVRARAARLEQDIIQERNRELGLLPARYGFETMGALIKALAGLGGVPAARRGRPAGSTNKPRRTRATITDETRATVKKMAEDGKTGAQIAKAVGISLPSVQNTKKALGLVKKRK